MHSLCEYYNLYDSDCSQSLFHHQGHPSIWSASLLVLFAQATAQPTLVLGIQNLGDVRLRYLRSILLLCFGIKGFTWHSKRDVNLLNSILRTWESLHSHKTIFYYNLSAKSSWKAVVWGYWPLKVACFRERHLRTWEVKYSDYNLIGPWHNLPNKSPLQIKIIETKDREEARDDKQK